MLTSLIERNNYHTVINHSSMTFDLTGVNYYETRMGKSATSREALDKLREIVAEVSKEYGVKNRKHHKILLDNFCSIARYKMENDIWLNGVKIRGNRHFGVLSVMANRWHCGQMIAEDSL